MLADAEDVKTDLVRVLDALEQFVHPIRRPRGEARLIETGGETIDSYLHGGSPGIDEVWLAGAVCDSATVDISVSP